MTIWNRSDKIAEIYGALIAIALTVYFLIMYLTGLVHVIELRLLNIAIMFVGIYFALKQFRRTHHDHMNYFRAMGIGVYVALIGVSAFAFILFIILKLDGGLMQSIVKNEPMGEYLNAYVASAVILVEGLSSGLFATYVLLNWIRTDAVSDPIGVPENLEKLDKTPHTV